MKILYDKRVLEVVNAMGNKIETVRELFDRLDSTTYNHSVRVMALALEYEEYAGVKDRILSQAALVHDIGKVYITQKILDKRGRLTNLERLLVELHPYIGYCMLKERQVREDIARVILYHHGFNPPVLSVISDQYENSEVVNYSSRILRTLDAFEAITSDRSYHRGIQARDAISMLKEQKFNDNDGYDFLKKTAYGPNVDNSAVLRGNYLAINDSIDTILRDWETKNCN